MINWFVNCLPTLLNYRVGRFEFIDVLEDSLRQVKVWWEVATAGNFVIKDSADTYSDM